MRFGESSSRLSESTPFFARLALTDPVTTDWSLGFFLGMNPKHNLLLPHARHCAQQTDECR